MAWKTDVHPCPLDPISHFSEREFWLPISNSLFRKTVTTLIFGMQLAYLKIVINNYAYKK